MPEGGELLVSRDLIRPIVVGKKVIRIRCHPDGRYRESPPKGLHEIETIMGRSTITVAEVSVKGKLMYWMLEIGHGDRRWMHCTYGMSGQWELEGSMKHVALTIDLDDGTMLRFKDPRHFGTIKFTDEHEHIKKLASLGMDMSQDPDPKEFAQRLRTKPNVTLAEVLLNQRIVSGVGNYVRAEALYEARLSPHRLVSSTTDDELETLCLACNLVLSNAYKEGGASIKTYKNVDGAKGRYAQALKVYGRSKDPSGSAVLHEAATDGRTIWWVPDVQL